MENIKDKIPKHLNEVDALLQRNIKDLESFYDEKMSLHTTYHVGGNAKYFVIAKNISGLMSLLRSCDNEGIDYYVVGKGSNLLVSDSGFDGCIIQLGEEFKKFNYDENSHVLTVGAGTPLSTISQFAFSKSLSGLEFSVGIPGTVGGALSMNAGTLIGCMSDCVASISYLDRQDNYVLQKIAHNKIKWQYRSSNISEFGIAIECEIQLSSQPDLTVKPKMEALLNKRNASQPYGPCCGSVFKNPENHAAGELLEKCGLKGKRIGGAEFSTQHANFIINCDGASARDVKECIDLGISSVQERFGITLEPEVKLLGF